METDHWDENNFFIGILIQLHQLFLGIEVNSPIETDNLYKTTIHLNSLFSWQLYNSWDWRVEHENATGSAKSEIDLTINRSHMDNELLCLVNSSAMKVSYVNSDTVT